MSDEVELTNVVKSEPTDEDTSKDSEDRVEEPEDEEGEEGEEEDAEDEEDEEVDGAYIVKEITDIRLQRGVVYFKTIWEMDGSTTWEPIDSFPEGLEHTEIKRFKERFPDKYEDKIQKHKKRSLTNKLWTYVSLDNEPDRHEKVDANATTREAKALYDPNRLEDPDEAFLKNYDTGCRVSRSKSREMRKNIESSSADSRGEPKVVSPEKKKPGRGGGRKKKVEGEEAPKKRERKEKKTSTPRKRKREETTSSSPAPAPAPASAPDSDSASSPAQAPPSAPSPPSEPSSTPSSSAPIRKKPVARGYKLNSSDSSEDEAPETQRRKKTTRKSAASTSKKLEKPTDVVPPAPTPIPISKLPAIPKKTVVTPPTRKRSPSPELTEPGEAVMDPMIRYNDDTREEEESKKEIDDMFGPEEDVETFEEYKTRDMAERRARQKSHGLDDAINVRNAESCELVLLKLTPAEAINQVANSVLPLHNVLENSWLYKRSATYSVEQEENRKKQVELVYRAVLPFLHNGVMALVNQVDKNTMINLAINVNDQNLVELLCAIGSPLDIPNIHEASAVESALMLRLPKILEVILQYGGTFHYYVGEHLTDFQGEHLHVARQYLLNSPEPVRSQLLEMLNAYYKRLEAACREVRGPIIRIAHRELDFGPIVCLARSKLTSHIFRTVEFKMPDLWVHCSDEEEFKLIVIPMAWHEVDKRYYGSPFATKMQPPRINNIPCEHHNGIVYDATRAMFEKKRIHEELLLRKEHNPRDDIKIPKPTLCYLHIQFDPMEPLGFVACQLVRCLRKDSSVPSTFSAPLNPSPLYNTPRYSSPSSSGPPATPRI